MCNAWLVVQGEEIRVLQRMFFTVDFKANAYNQLFLAMMAIRNSSLLNSLSTLTNVDWTKKCHQLRSSISHSRQRQMTLEFEVTADIGYVALFWLVTHLKTKHVFLRVSLQTSSLNGINRLMCLRIFLLICHLFSML